MTEPSRPEDSTAGDREATEARRFAASFRGFLEWVHRVATDDQPNEVTSLLREFLDKDAAQCSVVSRELSPFEHVNLQTAINAWSIDKGRTVNIHGITLPPHWGPVTLQQILSGEGLPPIRLSAPALVDLPNGPKSTLACLRLAVLLVSDDSGRYALLVSEPNEHDPALRVEAVGLPVAAAQVVLAEIDSLRSKLNVYRGHLLEAVPTPTGGVSLTFAEIPNTARDDVILPEHVLGRIERHALGVAGHREALLGLGQHLKRGLLLFGPPGTGKTHTMRYLVAHMPGYTRLLLSGRSLYLIGSIAELARELEPAVVVLEDVDLVAEDRSFGPGGNPILFDLLDAMDGAAADADLLFLLTTNRADLLEPALAARPGRVDVAVEIALPDSEARRRLLHLYAREIPLQLPVDEEAAVVERTEGVTASFLKELVRRAVLEALQDQPVVTAVTAQHLGRALDDLLDTEQEVTRTLLGVGTDPAELPAGAGSAAMRGMVPPGWAGVRGRGVGFSRFYRP